MNEVEINSREDIFFENYSKIINIEALTMLDMSIKDIMPAVSSFIGNLSDIVVAKKTAV